MGKKKFFEALTFDDVLLRPGKSDILPTETDVSTFLTRNIPMNIPITSAAMDTVTEGRFAISLARLGGIGIIHRALSIHDQVAEVQKVKKSESGMITDPIVIKKESNISKALSIMKHFKISGIPVTEGKKLIGIITNRDIRFETDMTKKVADVMTSNLVTSREGTSFEEAKDILHEHKIEKLPIVDKKSNLKGLITIKDIEKRDKFPNACKDKKGRLRTGAAVGVGKSAIDRAEKLIKANVDVIAIDTAHGHSSGVIETLRKIKKDFDIDVIAGNISTSEAAEDLISAGADAMKVGMGPGSICTTRVVSGAGVPQISAIMDCYKISKENNVPLIADGGIKFSGDITKAIAAGATSVMIGSLFAGTDESPGEEIVYQGRNYKLYRGMGSLGAMMKGGKDRYSQKGVRASKLVPEGIEGKVPSKGPLGNTVHQLLGGLRSGMGYCGCHNLEELRTKTSFIRITGESLKESHPHDVAITREAPNYSF